MKSTKALPIWISKLPQQYRRQRSVRRPACSPAQAARPSPNTLRYPICRPSVARATTPRRPQHRRRPEPLLQHQLRRQPRHRRRHRRKLRLRPKHLPIRLLIHQKLPTHRIPLMHRQNRIPRRRHRKYSRSPKKAALPNSFFSQSMHKKTGPLAYASRTGFSILLFPSESISQSAFLLRRRYQHRFQGKRVRSGYLCMR